VKKTVRTKLNYVAFLIATILFTSCNQQVHFKSIAVEQQQSLSEPTPIPPDPVDPPVVQPPPPEPPPVVVSPPEPPPVVVPPPEPPPVVTPPPPVVVPPPVVIPPPPPVVPPPVVIPPPVQKAGACANDSSTQLLSCLKCEVPMNPPVPAQFSEKGQSLIDVMSIGCSIPNKSAPKNYVPPTKEQLIARLSRLSPTFYPDSPMSPEQKSVIEGLKNDPVLQKKMFGGLWYQPPYSDHYETYFGVSVAEMVYQVCYQSPASNFTPYEGSEIHSKAYMDCMNSSFSCKEKPEYVKANAYRKQLRQGMRESISNPYVAPPPTPAKKCKWESFEGNYEQGAEEVLARWLVSGYKVGIETATLAGKCEMLTSLPTGANKPRGEVKMSGYVCQ
jgi:hypothetical protein